MFALVGMMFNHVRVGFNEIKNKPAQASKVACGNHKKNDGSMGVFG